MRILKTTVTIIFAFVFFGVLEAQNTKTKLYNPEADAKLEIQKAVKLAKKTDRHVLLQVGGDW